MACFRYFCRNSEKIDTMKKRALVAGSLLLLAACTEAPRKEAPLEGYWIEVMPVNQSVTQGIRLDADGCAASIGMHTLRYSAWERRGERLLLTGESIGNGQTIRFTDTLDIVRLSPDSLTLGKYGMYRITYTRANYGKEAACALLDSLRQPSRTSVLEVRNYAGPLAAAGEAATCEVTILQYEHCGDGVFRLLLRSPEGLRKVHFGRMYTLRGDATDPNATVCQLRDFADSAIWNFRLRADRLEPLDEALADIGTPSGGLLLQR